MAAGLKPAQRCSPYRYGLGFEVLRLDTAEPFGCASPKRPSGRMIRMERDKVDDPTVPNGFNRVRRLRRQWRFNSHRHYERVAAVLVELEGVIRRDADASVRRHSIGYCSPTDTGSD